MVNNNCLRFSYFCFVSGNSYPGPTTYPTLLILFKMKISQDLKIVSFLDSLASSFNKPSSSRLETFFSPPWNIYSLQDTPLIILFFSALILELDHVPTDCDSILLAIKYEWTYSLTFESLAKFWFQDLTIDSSTLFICSGVVLQRLLRCWDLPSALLSDFNQLW